MVGLGQTAQGARLLIEGLAALRADAGALPFFVDNAARWVGEYHRKRSGEQAAPNQTAMLQGNKNRSESGVTPDDLPTTAGRLAFSVDIIRRA